MPFLPSPKPLPPPAPPAPPLPAAHGSRRPPRPVLLAATTAAAGLLLAACTGDTPVRTVTSTTAARSTTTATGPTTTIATSVEEEVQAAYLEIMDAYYRRLQHPDPADPTIKQFHTGASLKAVVARNRDLASLHLVGRFSAKGAPMPTALHVVVSGESAQILNCIVDDVQIVSDPTGKVVNDETGSLQFRSTLIRSDGRWKLRDQVLARKTIGPGGCA